MAAKPAAGVPLVVYSSQGYSKEVARAFARAAGVPVELNNNPPHPLLTQVEALGGNPTWGLVWADSATTCASLDEQGLLRKGFEPHAAFNSLGTASIPADKSYVPTGVTLADAVVYDKAKTPGPPASWPQLTRPAWKDAVATGDPAQSGSAYQFVAGMMSHFGLSQGERFFAKLKVNRLAFHTSRAAVLHALTMGKVKIALVASSAAIGAAIGDKKLAVKYLDPVTVNPSCIGINAKAPASEQAEAEEFTEFVLSDAGQKAMQTGDPAGDSLYYPVVQAAHPLPMLPPLTSMHTQLIDPGKWASQETAINAWFDTGIAS